MKYFNKWYGILFGLVIIASLVTGMMIAKACPEVKYIKVDKEKLMQTCNVTYAEYQKQWRGNDSFCPEGREAITAGSVDCDVVWSGVIIVVILAAIVYNIFYGLVYGLRFVLRKNENVQDANICKMVLRV